MGALRTLLFVAHVIPIVIASEGPKVTLDHGVFSGISAGLVDRFLGIPFAMPPVGDLRFRLPQAIPPYAGNYDATKYGLACPQQVVSANTASGISKSMEEVVPELEDCLKINVVKPASAQPNSKLPVVLWIHGGGFEFDSPANYDDTVIVTRSINMESPVLYVSISFRLTAFGFLAGKEVKAAKVGNIGLHDQREALRWIRKYISQFGGDPSKVTIFGQSSGAMSISLQMLGFDGNTDGLFRAAFMMSGGPIAVGDITIGQKYYDALVEDTGCSRANDTLACLRDVPYPKLKGAINKSPDLFSYQSTNMPWLPRADGVFLTDHPQKLVQQKKIANIPYIIGTCDDEGTIFSFSTLNVTTDAQFREWVQTVYIPGTSDAEIERLMKLYPSDVTQGSPFDTRLDNAFTPQFKRISAFQGDVVFHGPRRWMVENKVTTDVWVYVSKRSKTLPLFGSLHGSDLLELFGVGELGEALIRFATNLNPNSQSLSWPKFDSGSRNVLSFIDSMPRVDISQDNYREEAMKYLMQVTLAHPI